MINYKKRTFFILLPISLVLIFLLNQKSVEKEQTMIVAVSSFALYDITHSIAKSSLKVVSILPLGVDPHSFEPTPQMMVNIEKSALVIYSGSGLEPWVSNYVFKQKVLNMSKLVKLREIEEEEEEHHHEHGHSEEESDIDPHYWLDINNMKIATKKITQELISLQPKNRDLYTKHSEKYLKGLDKLQKMYTQGLSSCKQKQIVVNHNAYGYLAKAFNFDVVSLSGLSPEAQTDAKSMQTIIKTIQTQNISSIFTENFASTKTMKSIANEVGIRVEVLDSLGNITADEMDKDLSYEEIMKHNLKKLQKALECN